MDTYRTCQLGNASYRQFHILARGHDEVAKLVDYHHDIGHIFVPFLGVEAAIYELLVILLDVTHMSSLQQIVACVHLHTDRVQCLHHLGHIGDDGFCLIGQLRQKVMLDIGVDAELYLLGIHEHELQLSRMFLI